MKHAIRIVAAAFGFAATTVAAAPLGPLKWKLPPCARMEGDVLVVEVAPETAGNIGESGAHCEAVVDLSEALKDGMGAVLSVRVRASDVTKPDFPWNGVKAMLRYVSADDGSYRWPDAKLPLGTFDWRTAEIRINALGGGHRPVGGRATLVLGLQGCSGRAEFDLSTLDLSSEDIGLPRGTEDYVVGYPAEAGGAPRDLLRGTMLPWRNVTEDDIETLHRWGATLVRFQINRDWRANGCNRDLQEYWRWIDGRIDLVRRVLDWCGSRGMKVCVDLHSPPGGKRGARKGSELEACMFGEDEYADAFVETWRRIATGLAGHPALYGYDLVNEPYQTRPLPHGFWHLQKRAAEAVREIDPVTPIVFEANLLAATEGFRGLLPMPMDNVIYEVHVYNPGEFTHQGLAGNARSSPEKPIAWPGPPPGGGQPWGREWLRGKLAPVRDFQLRHGARIYVGEFSAVAWASGAGNYLRDCIELFEEYGWDWTYHAFRESPCWDVEMEGDDFPSMRRAADTPRKRALLEGFSRRFQTTP